MKMKCVMIIDETLPAGLIANTAAVMGMTLGKLHPEAVGQDVQDKTGRQHPGIVEFPVPVLRGSPDSIRDLRDRLYDPDYRDLTVVDFSDVAQRCKTYGDFMDRISSTEESALQYLGVGIWGDRKLVNRLTGSMPLLR